MCLPLQPGSTAANGTSGADWTMNDSHFNNLQIYGNPFAIKNQQHPHVMGAKSDEVFLKRNTWENPKK